MHVVDLDFNLGSQQTIECIAKEVEIQDLTAIDDYDWPLPPPGGSRGRDESTNAHGT